MGMGAGDLRKVQIELKLEPTCPAQDAKVKIEDWSPFAKSDLKPWLAVRLRLMIP